MWACEVEEDKDGFDLVKAVFLGNNYWCRRNTSRMKLFEELEPVRKGFIQVNPVGFGLFWKNTRIEYCKLETLLC